METIIRSGPEPFRARLAAIDPEKAAERLRALIAYAQTGEGVRADHGRALIEAVQTADAAARARECLAAKNAIPSRWLGALGGVSTRRIQQLVRDGVLRREGRRIAYESARAWLAGQERAAPGRVRAITERRLVSVAPSWWLSRQWKAMFYFEFGDVIEKLVPAGHRFGYDAGHTPFFEVLPGTMTTETLEEHRSRIRAELEQLDPTRGGWTSPSGASMYW